MSKPKKTLGRETRTERGFRKIEFEDYYNSKCSLQASSLAKYVQPGVSAIWLGVDDADPKCLHGDARKLGVKTNATCGWVAYPIPKEVMMSTRMHLDRNQVAALIKHLQNWLDHGRFQ